MSRRASLPGAEELFRRTSPEGSPVNKKAPLGDKPTGDKSTSLQVAKSTSPASETPPKAPRHDEKVTFYCTGEDLMAIERARLSLRAEHGVAADRGKIVRAALAYVLEDFEARSGDSILIRRLTD